MTWSLAHIQRLKADKKIVDYKIVNHDEVKANNPKASKFRNVKTTRELPGLILKFDSTKEACRFDELYFLQSVGAIAFLQMQVRFSLSVCVYVADFVYYDVHSGEVVVEDVKPKSKKSNKFYLLPEFKLKRKLMKEIGIDVTLK